MKVHWVGEVNTLFFVFLCLAASTQWQSTCEQLLLCKLLMKNNNSEENNVKDKTIISHFYQFGKGFD